MMAVTPSRVPRRAAASLPLMPLSLQHHFDRRIVSRPEVARRLVLAVPTHLQNPVCRNRPQVVGATGVVLIQPDSNPSSLQRFARPPRDPGDPARREPARPQLLDDVVRVGRSQFRVLDLFCRQTFVLRCPCNGTPTARVANTNASNPGLIFDMCPPSKVLSHVPTGPWFPCSVRGRVPHLGQGPMSSGLLGPKREPAPCARDRRITTPG